MGGWIPKGFNVKLDTIADWILQNFHPNRRLLDALKKHCRAQALRKRATALEATAGANQAVATEPSGDESSDTEAGPAVNGTDGKEADRRAAVDAYIKEVLIATGNVITRTDIWKSLRYKSRAEFERWESRWYEKHGKKPNATANRRFTKFVSEKPHLK